MNDWKNVDGDAIPGGSTDYLRALKRNNDAHAAPAAVSVSLAAPTPTPAAAPTPTPAAAPADRRRATRYKCEGSVEFYLEGSDVRTWGMVSDISRSGCYVELHSTSSVDTPVNMRLDVSGFRIRVKGIVRTSYPSLGMGIGFTEVDEANGAQLDQLLFRLSGGIAPSGLGSGSPQNPVTPGLLMVTNPTSALNAIATFFHSHRAMSREEFEELILQSQNSRQPALR